MSTQYDLIVVGTGSAGLSIAYPCRSAGWRVAVVDDRPYGGTCATRGCDPKKVLVGVADVVDWAHRMRGKGVAGEAEVSWPDLMRFKRSFTDPVPPAREKALAEAGIDRLHGTARFVDEATMEIDGNKLSSRFFALANGASPARLGIPGEELVKTSDDFLELDAMPRRIAFIGGGYIAMEFAHLAARAGAQATILHRGSRPLDGFDPDLVDQLAAHTRSAGVDLRLNAPVQSLRREGGSIVVTAGGAEIEADVVFHAAGRPPNTQQLNLEAAGVAYSRKGVTVDDFLCSTNPRVYAAGDIAASGPPLTPVAGYEGRVVADNLLNGNRTRADYLGCAGVVFTLPPLATVGLSEKAAREQGLKFRVSQGETSGWYASRRIAEPVSGYKVIIEENTGRILGAHLLGQGAEEVINVFALAVRSGLTASDLRPVLYSYPTHGSNIPYMLG